MRTTLLLFAILFQQFSFAKETIVIPFENGDVEFTAEIEESEYGDAIYIRDLSINILGVNHKRLSLKSEFGWGDDPYHWLCEHISKELFGHQEYKYASAYGYATTFGIFNFRKPTFFVVKRNRTFSTTSTYSNSGIYDSGFSCNKRELIY